MAFDFQQNFLILPDFEFYRFNWPKSYFSFKTFSNNFDQKKCLKIYRKNEFLLFFQTKIISNFTFISKNLFQSKKKVF